MFGAALREHYTATFRDPARVHAICEQYRAAPTLDVAHDEADLGVRPIRCPVLVLWSATGAVDAWYDPLAIWRRWASDVRGRAVDGGHFLPEEEPDAVTSELREFLGELTLVDTRRPEHRGHPARGEAGGPPHPARRPP